MLRYMEYYNLLPAANLMEKTEKGKISSNFYLLLTLIDKIKLFVHSIYKDFSHMSYLIHFLESAGFTIGIAS